MYIAFSPAYQQTQTVTATNPAASITVDASAGSLRIVNAGAAVAFIRPYPSSMTVAATTADLPIMPGQATTITKDRNHDKVSYYSAGSTTLYITPGRGL